VRKFRTLEVLARVPADDMTADALSRRERLVLGVGVTVLTRVARLAERLDRHDRHHGRAARYSRRSTRTSRPRDDDSARLTGSDPIGP
jgi:hypothetical protein